MSPEFPSVGEPHVVQSQSSRVAAHEDGSRTPRGRRPDLLRGELRGLEQHDPAGHAWQRLLRHRPHHPLGRPRRRPRERNEIVPEEERPGGARHGTHRRGALELRRHGQEEALTPGRIEAETRELGGEERGDRLLPAARPRGYAELRGGQHPLDEPDSPGVKTRFRRGGRRGREREQGEEPGAAGDQDRTSGRCRNARHVRAPSRMVVSPFRATSGRSGRRRRSLAEPEDRRELVSERVPEGRSDSFRRRHQREIAGVCPRRRFPPDQTEASGLERRGDLLRHAALSEIDCRHGGLPGPPHGTGILSVVLDFGRVRA